MELEQALLKRRSVRKFLDQEVSDEDIDKLMHAAMSGPSACNKKPWEFYVIKNKDTLSELKGASMFTHMNAPLAIIVVGDLKRSLPLQLKDFWIEDCSAATENILLRVTDLSLGAVWCGLYPQKKPVERVRKILNLSEKEVPLSLIWIGYPEQTPEPRDQYEEDRIHIIK